MPERDAIVAAARRYVGTPYHHQAALAGAGCDCLGLIRGVWRDLYGTEPETPPPYTPDWAEVGTGEPMLDAARRHLVAVALDAMGPGDVVLFRMRPGLAAKHAAILSDGGRMIHAQSRDRVREVTMNGWWRRHLAAGFGWPEALTRATVHYARVAPTPVPTFTSPNMVRVPRRASATTASMMAPRSTPATHR